MKRFLLVSIFLVLGSFLFAQEVPVFDAAPFNPTPVDTTPSANFPYHTVFNWNYQNIGGVNSGTVGAMYFDNKFYLNKWNTPSLLYRYNGGLFGPTTVADSNTYQGAIRDMATDGTWLYGSPASTTIHRMNAAGISQGTITSAGGAVRTIAYSPDENVFFVSDFSNNIGVINATTGALVRTLAGTSALAGKYGMAYSNLPGDVPAVWAWGQGTNADPYNKLWKLNPQTGAILETYQFGPLPPSGGTSPFGIAGGAEIVQIDGHHVLLLNYQNYALAGYSLGLVPVELTSFTAASANNEVILNWQTATEVNNKGFEVERKLNDVWNAIGYVDGKGTTTDIQNYTYTDKNVASGQTYSYRLKQVDYNGQYEYSNVIEIEVSNIPSQFELVQNFPNPFNPTTRINFNLAVDSRVSIKIFNSIGEEVKTLVSGNYSAGLHNETFDASGLNSGVYVYKIEAVGIDGKSFTAAKKMILAK